MTAVMTDPGRSWDPPSDTIKFPEFDSSVVPPREHGTIVEEQSNPSSPVRRSVDNWPGHGDRSGYWKPNANGYANGLGNGHSRAHGRQKSLSDAFKTIRTRKGSVSANAHEIADALRAPVSWRLIGLCLTWYLSSALTNTSSKTILQAFPRPVTLTLVQFAFVSGWCLVLAEFARRSPAIRESVPALRHGIRPFSRDVLQTTLPLALFQLGGHVLSSTATAKIPVSLVHTIKGLSPLFTVLAYRLLFNVHYSFFTYLSLIPLTLGVILACSAEISGNIIGIFCALIAALIFVAQNIFSKSLFNEAARAEAESVPASQQHPRRLDKLNLLYYCSGLAFLLTFPLWLWTEGFTLLNETYRSGSVNLSHRIGSLDHGRLGLEFCFNGAVHFGQNILAFVLLSMVSPVTYSVASLIKRVFVIVVAILWFRQATTKIQVFGIGLTFLGLYLYDRTHDSARAAKHLHRSGAPPLLPLEQPGRRMSVSTGLSRDLQASSPSRTYSGSQNYSNDEKKADAAGPGRPSSGGRHEWLPPGTRQEATWERPRVSEAA